MSPDRLSRQSVITSCRTVLEQIKEKQVLVGGGSGRRERYEMRETLLYFKLGSVLLEYFQTWGTPKEKRVLLYGQIWNATKDLDLNEQLLRWSVRFVEAFPDEEYFQEISALSRNSFGQMRELVEILAKNNPLKISEADLIAFRDFLGADHTYEAMQRRASDLRAKYVGSVEGHDLAALTDLFQEAEQHVTSAVEAGADQRNQLRSALGDELIRAIRYTLMLLSRESTLDEVRMRKPVDLRTAKRQSPSTEPVISRLHAELLRFLDSDLKARESLRKWIDPKDMGQMQRLLKAIESEKEYQRYERSEKMLQSLFSTAS